MATRVPALIQLSDPRVAAQLVISLYGGSHASDVLHVLMGVSVA